MNPNRDDMNRIGEELEKELQNLHLPDRVKQKLSQKMKKPYRQHRGAWMALPAAAVFAVLLVYGWLGQSVRDQTDAPVPMSSVPIDHVVARVNVRNLDAILYSARADENGGIWLEYAVNTVADVKVVVRNEESNTAAAYGIGENDLNQSRNAQADTYTWTSFNDYTEKGPLPPVMAKSNGVVYEVFYITGFALKDAAGETVGTWRHSGHSLMQSGMILSSYEPADGRARDVLLQSDAGDTLTIAFDGVPAGSSVYTSASGQVWEENGSLTVTLPLGME